MFCPLISCRPLVKIFVAKRSRAASVGKGRYSLRIGLPRGGSMEIESFWRWRDAWGARRIVSTWLRTEDGQACYRESLKMLLGGIVLRETNNDAH